jgi:hypothetical protein
MMRWLSRGADVLLACLGVIQLLYAHRLVGKPPGTDEKYDAAMARQGWMWKASGWCIIGLAVIGLVGYLMETLW